jgi:hypothetical protein
MSKATDVDTKIDQLSKYFLDLLSEIATTDDERVIRIAANAPRLERFAFLIRGTCASVLRQRYQCRLPGGRGKRDLNGIGIRARMTKLAEHAGVDRRTLEVDARISDTFFAAMDETTLEHIPPLAREYYVVALPAPDPRAAIRKAAERRSESHYGLSQFRTDVRQLKRVAGSHATPPIAEQTRAVRVRIPAEVGELMAELVTISQKTRDEIVAEAIRMLHASLTKRVARKRRDAETRRKPAQTRGDRQLELML